MNNKLNSLARLQDVLSKMFEIEDAINDIPKSLKDKQAMLSKTKKAYVDLCEKVDRTKKELASDRFDFDEATRNREKCEKMMESITLSREYETLQKEIEEAKVHESELRMKISRKESILKEDLIKLQDQEEIMKAQQAEVEEEESKIDEQLALKRKELEEVSKEKEACSADIDPNMLFKFERIIRNKGRKGIVPVHGVVCQGCHMMLPAQFANDLRKQTEEQTDDWKFCPYCSRVLYYEETDDSETQFNDFANLEPTSTEEEESSPVSDDIIDSDEFSDI